MIENIGTGEIFPLVAAQVITTLEPGESRTFEFTYDELVNEIGNGTIEARVSTTGGCPASTTFTLTRDGAIATDSPTAEIISNGTVTMPQEEEEEEPAIEPGTNDIADNTTDITTAS